MGEGVVLCFIHHILFFSFIYFIPKSTAQSVFKPVSYKIYLPITELFQGAVVFESQSQLRRSSVVDLIVPQVQLCQHAVGGQTITEE